MNISISSGSVTINGETYYGSSVSIVGDKVIVDGKEQTTVESKKIDVTVNGNVDSLSDFSGIVVCENITGDVKTVSGFVSVTGTITGNVKTVSGSVQANSINGSVKTVSGNISK